MEKKARTRIEKLNRAYLAKFRNGEEAAYVASKTVDRVSDKEVPGFHIRIRKLGSQFAWANAKHTFTIGSTISVDPDKARAIALGIKERVSKRQGVEDFNPDEIRAWVQEALFGIKVKVAEPNPGWTLAQLREKFLSFKEAKGAAAATLRNYRSDLNCPEIKELEKRRCSEITKDDAVSIRDSVAERGTIQSNRVLAALSSMFTYAEGEPTSKVHSNPIAKLNRLGQETKRKRFLTFDELKRFLAALPTIELSPSVGIAMLWALATGQRKRAVRLTKKEALHDEHWHSLPKKKGAEGETRVALIPIVPLMDRLIVFGRTHCRADSVWLFPSERTVYRGKARDVPITESALNGVISRLCTNEMPEKLVVPVQGIPYKISPQQAGPLSDLKSFTIHDFRRTVTTLCRTAGLPRSFASSLLDHDDDDGAATITGQVYDQYEPVPERKKALEVWHEILSEAGIDTCLAALEEQWTSDGRAE